MEHLSEVGFELAASIGACMLKKKKLKSDAVPGIFHRVTCTGVPCSTLPHY